VRNVIFPLVILTAILVGATRTLAQIDVELVTPTPTTWQIWVQDATNTDDLGIANFGGTVTPVSGTVSCPATTGEVAPEDTADDANGDILGFSTYGIFGNNKTSLNILASQQSTGGALVQDTDSAVFGVGQAASATNNYGNFVGYRDLAGDVVSAGNILHSATNLAGSVEMFAGTNSVAGSVGLASLSAFSSDNFTNSQPNDGGNYSTTAWIYQMADCFFGYNQATPTTYRLLASTAARQLHVSSGASYSLINTTITNTGTGLNSDSLTFAGVGSSVSPLTGGYLTPAGLFGGYLRAIVDATSTSNTQTFSSPVAGTYTFTPSIGTVTNYDLGSPVTLSSTSSVTVNVYTGLGIWHGSSGGAWLDYGNWDSTGGVPGIYDGFANTDSATFGTTTAGSVTVNLNTSPSINALTLNSTTTRYTIAQASYTNATLHLNGNGNANAAVAVTGNHVISAPVALDSNTTVTTSNASSLTFSGSISGSSTSLTTAGSGSVILSGDNSYSGGTSITSGTVVAISSTALGTGNVIVSSAAHLTPGLGGGAPVTAESIVILDDGCSLDYDFGATGKSHASPGISSMLAFAKGASLVLPSSGEHVTLNNVSATTFTGTGSYELFSYTPGTTLTNFVGTGGTYIPGPNADLGSIVLGSGFSATEQYSLVNDPAAGGIFLDYMPTPEPASLSLLALGGVAVLLRRPNPIPLISAIRAIRG
jgi:autotransporter-associated beta strand protein